MTKKRTLSPEQDYAANPLENAWVQANAGTGKTSVLVQRLLRILFRTPDCTSSGILCLTYTNAGAGEMRNRILSALREWALAPDDELAELLDDVAIKKPVSAQDILHAREIFFQFIDNPDILKIKTIHGFCEEILHRFPLEAGISPSWSLVSDAAQRVLLQDAFSQMINNPSKNEHIYPAFAHIVDRVSETYMTDLLNILSNQYKQFFNIKDIVKYREQFIDTSKNFLNLSTIKIKEPDVKNLEKIISTASEEQKNAKKPAKYLDEIINLTKQYIDNTVDFEKYKTAYLTASGDKKTLVSKKDFLVDEQDRVYETNRYNTNMQTFNDTIALFDLSSAFAQKYAALKRARNLLDFEDLILYTQKLFSSPDVMGWVLSQLDLSLSHILLDEAQDTSPLQWEILRVLSGDFFTDSTTDKNPHSLFVVGDTKQSIYGFQGADPRAFAESRDIIHQHIQANLRTIKEIPLAQSFRSTAPILYAVDTFFSNPKVIEISDFANNPHKCFRTGANGAVEIHALTSKQTHKISIKEYVANISDKIEVLIKSGKYDAKDIMVLVQQRNPMTSPLTYELKRRNIEVAGSDRIVLPNYPPIRDLLNLARWCISEDDDYSLCCVLKSPIFCLNEQSIFDLCKKRNNANKNHKDAKKTTIFDTLDDIYPDIKKYLLDTRAKSIELAPYSFFTTILKDARKSFITALGAQVVEPLEEFLTICLSYERTQPGTLRHFLKWFITGGSEIKRDMNASNGVRIVTVHGSKGLESPVVFLIDTVRTPKSENIIPVKETQNPTWLWIAHNAKTPEQSVATKKLDDARIAEYYRLLYVAMTRARDELYIYGYTPHKNANDNSWHSMLWDVFTNKNTEQAYIRITNDNIK